MDSRASQADDVRKSLDSRVRNLHGMSVMHVRREIPDVGSMMKALVPIP